MNKLIKERTVKKYHYETGEEFEKHLMSFILYYNHQKPLKSLNYKSPFSIILEKFDTMPSLFKNNSTHKLVRLNNLIIYNSNFFLINWL